MDYGALLAHGLREFNGRLTAGRAEISVNGPGNAAVNVVGRNARRDDDDGQLLVVDRSGSRQVGQ